MNKLIKPEILKGTRDFLPLEMAKRNYIMDQIKSVFWNFGYDAIETPSIEYAKTILGKYWDEWEQLTYKFNDNWWRAVALRYDQTVPFSRLVAANYQELPMPFKRYQIWPVWRADKPGKGRYREFYQCDIDIIWTKNLTSETEISKLIYNTLSTLWFKKFIIKFNSRKLLNSILNDLQIPKSKQASTIRILDKLEKIWEQKVIKEMSSVIDVKTCKSLMKISNIKWSNKEKLIKLKKYDTIELEKFLILCKASNIPEQFIELDPSLARWLDYYTGITFEVFIPDVNIWAVCAGWRYDNLCWMFIDKEFSWVWVAFGFDRIMLACEQLWLLKKIWLNSKVLVTYFDDQTLNASLSICDELQNAGISSEMYFQPDKLKKQIKYADKKEIPFVIFIGPEEIENNQVKIKIMKTWKEKIIPESQLIIYLSCFYEKN